MGVQRRFSKKRQNIKKNTYRNLKSKYKRRLRTKLRRSLKNTKKFKRKRLYKKSNQYGGSSPILKCMSKILTSDDYPTFDDSDVKTTLLEEARLNYDPTGIFIVRKSKEDNIVCIGNKTHNETMISIDDKTDDPYIRLKISSDNQSRYPYIISCLVI